MNNQVNFISNFRSLFLHSYVVEGHMRKNYSPANEPSSPALYEIKGGIVEPMLPLSISWYALDIRYRIAYTHTQLHFVISLWWCPGRERNVALFSYGVKSFQYVQPSCYVMLVSLQWFGCIGIGQDINLTYMLHVILFDYM